MARARIDYLDGLRGVAALVVAVQHIVETIMIANPASRPMLQPEFLDYFNAGRFGVALFFLISGFVIPFSFREPSPIRGFVISRFFRLYPAYWLSLALALLVLLPLAGEAPSLPRVLANISMFQAALHQKDVIGVYWTLAVELAFYGLCAGLFAMRLLSDSRTLIGVIGVCLAVSLLLAIAAMVRGSHLPANITLNLGLMAVGTLMRRAWLDQDIVARRWLRPMIVLWAVSVPLIQWLTPEQTFAIAITPLSFCMAYWVALLVFIGATRFHWSPSPGFIGLGAVSYSFYLFHTICIEVVFVLMRPLGLWSALAFAMGALAATLAVSTVVHILVERPAIALGRRIIRSHLAAPRPLATQQHTQPVGE